MKDIPGPRPSEVKELAHIQDRMTFLYVERCIVERDANAITFTDKRGTVHVPSAAISALLFGPGTNVTHQAMVLLADSGATAIWVGEQGVRMYVSGRSMARSSRLISEQAKLVSNRSSRLAVARRMYQMRFLDEDVSSLSMQQLRGREGARVRSGYKKASEKYKVKWSKREYDPNHFDDSDAINQALSAANACLYGIVHAVVVSLGASSALGFVHTGHDLSFVYDVADLYKMDYSVPIAFQTVGQLQGSWVPDGSHIANQQTDWTDLSGLIRRRMRDLFKETRLLARCVRDIKTLLLPNDFDAATADNDAEVLTLWDEKIGEVAAGKSYSFTPIQKPQSPGQEYEF